MQDEILLLVIAATLTQPKFKYIYRKKVNQLTLQLARSHAHTIEFKESIFLSALSSVPPSQISLHTYECHSTYFHRFSAKLVKRQTDRRSGWTEPASDGQTDRQAIGN